MKNKLRKIVVNGETFLWKREHLHLVKYEYSKCVEKVSIYLKDYKNSRLELHFRGEDNLLLFEDVKECSWQIGYPDDGVLWFFENDGLLASEKMPPHINLNRPAVISKLITHFYNNEWKPKENIQNKSINSLKYLEIIDFPNKIYGENKTI